MSWPWRKTARALPSSPIVPIGLLALAGHELRMTLRERAGWAGAITACTLAGADAALRPHLPLVGGLRASTFGGPLVLTPLVIVFVAGAARRDDSVSAGECVTSRPYPAHWLMAARLLGNLGLTGLLYGLVIVSSVLPSLLLEGRIASPLVLVHAWVRGIIPLLYVTVLAYCAVTLARNVLAAAVVAVYWLFVLLWGDFLARIFNFALTQNWPTYAAIGLTVALGTLAIQRRGAREATGTRWRTLLPGVAILLLVLGLADAWNRVAHSHDKPLRQDPVMLSMAAQHLEGSPRLPGFWLPDQHGRGYRLSEADGRVLVVGFWSPHVPRSVAVLDLLRGLSRELGPQQVRVVAVCLSNDHAISPHVAREGAYQFPMVTDIGTHFAGKVENCSPVAEACLLTDLPRFFVTDRARRVVGTLGWAGPDSQAQVVAMVRQALTVPVPPVVE